MYTYPITRPITRALLSTISRSEGIVYDTDAQAFFDRLSTEPDTSRKLLVNNLIVSAKEHGWWDKSDAIYLMAWPEAVGARTNLKQSSYNLTAFSSPVFTVDRGFTGDGAAAYLSSNFNPTTAVGANFVQDSANIAAYSLSTGQGASSDAGYYSGTSGTTLQFRDTSNNATGRVNQSSVIAAVGSVTDGSGFLEIDRSAASGTGSVVMRKAGAVVTTNVNNVPSTTPSNGALQFLRYGTSGFSARQLAIGVIGGHLTDAESLNRYNDILTYLQAIGAV